MIWFVYAVLASLFWGLSYALADQALRRVSVPTLIVFEALANGLLALGMGLWAKSFGPDWATLRKSVLAIGTGGGRDIGLFLACLGVFATANLFIALSIQHKNATMAGMIEITYPLFTAFFAWALFRETQVNAGTLTGAALIFTGVCCIYFYGKNL